MTRFLMALALALSACGGDDHEEGPNCTALSDACHEADEAGVEGAAECHDIAHEGDEDACEAAMADCEATCSGGGDTGTMEM